MQNTTPTAPVDGTTTRIAGLYGRILDLDPDSVGGDVDFFAGGGTSLSALDLLDLIHAEFDVRVPVRTFYQATTAHELAREVDLLVKGS